MGICEAMSFPIYHCGRCGSLFQAELGRDDDRVCDVCRQKPGTGEVPSVYEKQDGRRESAEGMEKSLEPSGEKAHRGTDKRRSKSLLLRIVAFWALMMGGALWLHRHNSGVAAVEVDGNEADREVKKVAMLASALPGCHKSLAGFLSADSPEERQRFVANPIATAGKMTSFYGLNPFPQVDTGSLARIGQELLRLDGEWMVRTLWQEGEGGYRFDAVFRLESGEWLLDWDHFARFSSSPWVPFLAGDGPDEGEFRLLAREIPRGDKAERRERQLRFALLSPEAWGLLENPEAAQEFVVDRLSDDGLLLESAFAASREGAGPFAGAMEPEGLVRIRVILKRIDFGGVRKFEVGRIIACHWITSDAPGFDIGKLKDDIFGGN